MTVISRHQPLLLSSWRLKIWISLLSLAIALPLWANGVNIVAIVNGKAITSTALENRLQLVFASSSIPDNAETRKRFTSQILNNLIDEVLERQEAQKNSIVVTPDDLKRAIADLEKRNKMKPGTFEDSLADRGIDKDSALEQISARLLWQKLSLRKLRSHVNVSDSDLNEGLEQFARKQNRREYELSEIVLPILEGSKREDIRSLADHIVAEVRAGGEFATLARQFSASSTALQGGDTGWVPEERLEHDAVTVLRTTQEGQITQPIETPEGIKIYKLQHRYDPKDVAMDIKQLQLTQPLPPESLDLFTRSAKEIKDCSNADEIAEKIKSALPESSVANFSKLDFSDIKLTDLSEEFRDDVAALNQGQVSGVLNKPSGLYIFVVCSRSASSNTMPDPEKVREVILRGKLDLEAQRYLNQLRHSAFIEKR